MARQPFFGRGPAPQIARMDMQAATAPGKHWGAAIESIGQTVGQAVEKHRENKKAKKKERDFIDSFEARISKSPEFARSLGLNTEDTDEIRLAGKVYFNTPEARQFAGDFSRFQEKERARAEKERARAGTTEYLDLMLPSQAETVEPSDSGIRDFFAQARATDEAAGLAPIRSPSAFTARLEGMPPIKSPEAKELILGHQLGLQKAKEARDISDQAQEIALSNAMFTNQLKLNEEKRKQIAHTQEQGIMSFDGLKIGGGKNALILQGKIGDKAEAKKGKEGLINLNAILRDLDQLIELGYQRENNMKMSDDAKTKSSQLANRIRGQIREEILGPGTVTEDEFKRLADQVPDPVVGNWFGLGDAFSAQYGEEGAELLEQVKADLITKVKEKYAAYGVTTGGTTDSANIRQTSTGKNVEIIFDPAD
jgi:hypothetical protein